MPFFLSSFAGQRVTGLLAAGFGFLLLTGCATPAAFSSKELAEAADRRLDLMSQRQQALGDGVSLAEALTWAMDNNLSLRAAQLERTMAGQNRKLASMGMLPGLALQAGYRSRSNDAASSSANVVTGTQSLVPSYSSERDVTTASLEASWNVLDFGLAWLRAQSEGEKQLMAEEARRRMAQQVALDVVYAWDRALVFQKLEPELLAAREKVLKNWQQNEAIAATGLRDPLEVYDYGNALLLVLKRLDGLALQMNMARDDLARLLGVPAGMPFRLDGDTAVQLKGLPEADVSAWQYVALLNRPEVRESLYGKRNADRGAFRRTLEAFPALLLRYSGNYDSNSFLVNDTWRDASASLSLSLVRLAAMPLNRRIGSNEKAQAEVQADLQATAVLSQVVIARKAEVSAGRQACFSRAMFATSGKRLGVLADRFRGRGLDELSLDRAQVDHLLISVESELASVDERRARLMMAQSVGLGAWPEQVAESGEERVFRLTEWLQGGLAEVAKAQLAEAEGALGKEEVAAVQLSGLGESERVLCP